VTLNLLPKEGGEVFFGLALIAAGAIVFLAARARRRRAGADFPAEFVPHVAVELTLGRNGFSVRFDAALQPGVPQPVDAQFLKPELTLLGQNEDHEPGQGRRPAV
jgi:hypothetical protein